MNSIFDIRAKLDSLFSPSTSSIYGNRFYEDLSSDYSFILGDIVNHRNFFTIEPTNCKLAKLLQNKKHYISSYDIEQVIEQVSYNLIRFGRSFILITPDYTINHLENGKEIKKLSSIQIGELNGFIKHRGKTDLKFCYRNHNGKAENMRISKHQLVELNIKDIGFKRNYFREIARKLSKCEIALSSTMMIENKVDGYDFSLHSKISKLQELKATKDIGWSFGTEGLSDSYILFRKIQSDKLKIKVLEYILLKINEGLHATIEECDGKIIANFQPKDYDHLWANYQKGALTGSELSNILYNAK